MAISPLPRDGRSRRAQARIATLAASARDQLPAIARTAARPARALAFWSAIALPVLNLALLFQGLSNPSETATFLVLLGANLLALLLGHPYGRD